MKWFEMLKSVKIFDVFDTSTPQGYRSAVLPTLAFLHIFTYMIKVQSDLPNNSSGVGKRGGGVQ